MINSSRLIASVLLFSLAAPLVAQDQAPFRVVETGEGFRSLQSAVNSIGARRGTILIRSGQHDDCAVQTQGHVTYRALTPGKAILDGGVCEDKATLVLRGSGAVIEGLIFRNVGVADGNGAGIRLERGNLDVVNAMFRDSEQGILTADDARGRIMIDRSTFSGLGRCDRGLSCAHSIYVGRYGALSVRHSRFERGNGGHYVKSRAAGIEVTDSSFDDTRGRTTNYMIDLPEGATGTIARNIFVQGRDKENYSAFIAVAAEARRNTSRGLTIVDNNARVAPGIERRTTFLADWSGEAINLGANRLGPNLKPFEKRQ